MKTVVICNSLMKDAAPNNFYEQFLIDNDIIPISVLDIEQPNYDDVFEVDENLVLVQISAFSCNFRDRGLMHSFKEKCQMLSKERKYFYSPVGSEFTGIVVRLGRNVTSLRLGDRVMPNMAYPYKVDKTLGGVPSNYASQRILLFSENELIRVPDMMSDEEAAAFTLSAQTAYGMVGRADIKGGENILVTSATSNTSLAIIRHLSRFNINIYAVTNRPELLKRVFNKNEIMQIFSINELENLSPAFNFDVVFDPFIDLYINRLFPHLSYNAKYIYCGCYIQSRLYDIRGVQPIYPYDIFDNCIIRNISLIGNCLGSSENLINAINDYQERKFYVKIDSVYSGNNIKEFFYKSFLDKERIGKVVYKY